MKSAFINWIVPFVCGGLVALVATMSIKLKALRDGLQCLLRAEIIRSHDKYVDRGYAPHYAKEALTKAYKSYHNLGGNDVATALYNEIMELPSDKPEEKYRRKKQ